MELIYPTWSWYISGFIIGLVMLALIYFGKSFGMSSNLRTLCSIAGAGQKVSFRFPRIQHTSGIERG